MGRCPYITQNVSITELFSPLRLIFQIVSLIRLLITPAHFGALSAVTTRVHTKLFFFFFFSLSITGLCQLTRTPSCARLLVAGGWQNGATTALLWLQSDSCRLFQKTVCVYNGCIGKPVAPVAWIHTKQNISKYNKYVLQLMSFWFHITLCIGQVNWWHPQCPLQQCGVITAG